MAKVTFTRNIQRHVACPPGIAPGKTVGEVLRGIFAGNPPARDYVLDDQGALRKHIAVFVDGQLIRDREHLGDVVRDDAEIYIMQALSGG